LIELKSQLIVAKPLPRGGGYTWTLASLLGSMLSLAENRFGKRDRTHTILGVEFVDGIPQCWYPGNCGNVVVQLSIQCLREPDRACFQLAHEVIHLLAPSGGRNANVLEEGLATHFQSWYMANHYPPDWPRSGLDWNAFECQSYVLAKGLVEELLILDPGIVRSIREREPMLSRVTSEMLTGRCAEVSRETADALTRRFVRQGR